ATFRNEPPADFAMERTRIAMQRAVDDVRQHFGKTYPLWIDGAAVSTDITSLSLNPSHKRQIVGYVHEATAQHARQAVDAASRAWPDWAGLSAQQRAELIRNAAEIMRRRRFELAAWEVHECGKGWREADGDVCEAIDFCEYYAQGAIDLQGLKGADVPGEENRFEYWPRGVAAVIAPWNFPLAILTGMTIAALATGNTVVMKPSEQSSVVGAKLMEIFSE